MKDQNEAPLEIPWNRLTYTDNNPLRLVDPSGMLVEYADESLQKRIEGLAATDKKFGAELQKLVDAKETFRYQYGNVKGSAEGVFEYSGTGELFTITVEGKPSLCTLEPGFLRGRR